MNSENKKNTDIGSTEEIDFGVEIDFDGADTVGFDVADDIEIGTVVQETVYVDVPEEKVPENEPLKDETDINPEIKSEPVREESADITDDEKEVNSDAVILEDHIQDDALDANNNEEKKVTLAGQIQESDRQRHAQIRASREQRLIDEFEEAGLLEEEYDDFDEVYVYSERKPKKWKKREQRLWVRIVTKLLIAIVVLGGLGCAFVFGFKMTNINISGNFAYSDEEILEMLGYSHYPKNTIIFCWKNKDDITGNIPFIERISVSFGGPNTVNIKVSEKSIIGCINNDGLYMFFDNTGTVVESSTSKSDGVPEVTGLDITGLEIGDTMDLNDVSIFNNLYELSILLKNYDVSVDQIEYRSDRTLVMNCGTIRILLGTGTNLEDKINAYKDLEANLEGMTGTLHLEDYDSSKDSIFFSKES